MTATTTLLARAALSFARLRAVDRSRALEHLLGLPEADRRLRFGHGGTATIERYIGEMDFDREIVLGAFGPQRLLVALAHVPIRAGVAELGLSVAPGWRRIGVGLSLADQALSAACRSGARLFRFHFAASNDGMHRIARALALRVERDGSDFIAQCALSAGTSKVEGTAREQD